jgi:hypothetical protein
LRPANTGVWARKRATMPRTTKRVPPHPLSARKAHNLHNPERKMLDSTWKKATEFHVDRRGLN